MILWWRRDRPDSLRVAQFRPNYSGCRKFANLNNVWIRSYIVELQPRHWGFESHSGTLFHFVYTTIFPFKSTLVFTFLIFCKTNTTFSNSSIQTIKHTKQSWISKFPVTLKFVCYASTSLRFGSSHNDAKMLLQRKLQSQLMLLAKVSKS